MSTTLYTIAALLLLYVIWKVVRTRKLGINDALAALGIVVAVIIGLETNKSFSLGTISTSDVAGPVMQATDTPIPPAKIATLATLLPASTVAPTATPISQSAEQAVKNYYAAINNRQYGNTWATLTTHFKDVFNCCTPTGQYDFDAYRTWWESVARVEIGQIATIVQEDETATVYAELTYRLKNGRTILDEKPYIKLRLDTANNKWLFDDKGPNP